MSIYNRHRHTFNIYCIDRHGFQMNICLSIYLCVYLSVYLSGCLFILYYIKSRYAVHLCCQCTIYRVHICMYVCMYASMYDVCMYDVCMTYVCMYTYIPTCIHYILTALTWDCCQRQVRARPRPLPHPCVCLLSLYGVVWLSAPLRSQVCCICERTAQRICIYIYLSTWYI